jgi:hypothetical protein
MARAPSGPLGNSPRDERDSFVGEPAEQIKAGPPLRWPPNPKKITKDTFHAKVEGKSGSARADRSPTFRRGGWVSGYKTGGVLSAADRKALPSKSFALPGKGKGPEGKGAGSYPIPDASHARNALARVSQHGSSSEKARVRSAVHRKFPGIGQK